MEVRKKERIKQIGGKWTKYIPSIPSAASNNPNPTNSLHYELSLSSSLPCCIRVIWIIWVLKRM
jgi:hypothetical protein